VEAAPAGDPIYRGLVALLGSYIAGQQQLAANPVDIKNSMKENDEQLNYCVDANDIKEYITSRKIEDKDTLEFAKKKYGDTNIFYAALDAYLSQYGPTAAKLRVPVLSRTSLNELVSKVRQLPDFQTFLQSVLAAAGVTNPRLRLFPYGLQSARDRGRTVEDNPDITIGDWVKSVHKGENLTWSENVFEVENVGPKLDTKFCCFGEVRAEGVVLELRDTGVRVRPDDWVPLATEMRDLFTALNAAT
ncbi:MAG: hypothetical protein JO023_14725, partial [Chloroflexi bacterium]|nr:hypothetical protein [Chloroflexota bacterium]